MFGLAIDPNGGDSLVDQLAEGLIARIADGRLAPGERLPSSRTLADALGIHRNTVTAAFRRLGEDGWLESQVGRGTFVAESLPRVAPVPEQGTGPRFDWASYQPRRGRTPGEEMASAYDSPQHPDTISFAGGVPDPALYPADEVRKLCRELLRGDDTLLFRYGPAAGYEPLRELVRQEAARDGVASESFEVLITNGSSQGLDLFLRFACEPGATVVATSPCYPGALHLFEVHGVHCRTVPIGPHGISSGELDRALSGERPRLVHLIPSFHNPTGWTMSLEERRFVLERCQEDRIPIFEDDYGPGLRFEGAEPPTLLAMSPQGGVVQSGTLSKIAFPGFRIGWLLVPREIYSEIHEIRRCSDLGGSLFPQMVLYEFWRRGGLERHVKKVRREYGARRDALLEALSREMPDGTRWSEPSGGLVLWLELPDERDALELLPEAAKAGVLFAPGAFFHPSGRGGSGLRLSFGSVPADRIAEGIRRLGRVLARTSRSGTRRSGGPSVTDSSLAV